MRVVTRSQFPIGFSRHRIDGQAAQVDFCLSRYLANFRCIHALLAATAHRTSRQHVDSIDERFEIRWKVVRVINSKDRAIADDYLAARIDDSVLLLLRLLLRRKRDSRANHSDSIAM